MTSSEMRRKYVKTEISRRKAKLTSWGFADETDFYDRVGNPPRNWIRGTNSYDNAQSSKVEEPEIDFTDPNVIDKLKDLVEQNPELKGKLTQNSNYKVASDKQLSIIILDRSGSMNQKNKISPCKKGIHNLIDLSENESRINEKFVLITFDDLILITEGANKKIRNAVAATYPRGMTSLLDAIWATKKIDDEGRDVIVTIFTDGMENNSKISSREVKNYISEKSSQNWVFSFMGTNSYSKRYAINTLGIPENNVALITDDQAGFEEAMETRVKMSKMVYRSNLTATAYDTTSLVKTAKKIIK